MLYFGQSYAPDTDFLFEWEKKHSTFVRQHTENVPMYRSHDFPVLDVALSICMWASFERVVFYRSYHIWGTVSGYIRFIDLQIEMKAVFKGLLSFPYVEEGSPSPLHKGALMPLGSLVQLDPMHIRAFRFPLI